MADTGIPAGTVLPSVQQQQRSSGVSSVSSSLPATTTISTIAVQSGATRIVVALLQVNSFISIPIAATPTVDN